MNGIERITSRIASDADEAAQARLEQARTEAEQITERYRAQAEAEARELAERGEKAAAEREERLVSTAQMEARKVLLSAKQEMVERAYALALEKLCSLPEEQYVDVLAGLLEAASSSGTEEVIFSPKDRKSVGQKAVDRANGKSKPAAVSKGKPGKPAQPAKPAQPEEKAVRHLTLSKETADIRGGFILRDRNVEVNCTFETLVRLQRGQAAGAVAKLLFPAGA